MVIFKNKEIKSFLQLRSVRLHFHDGYHLIVNLGMLNLPYIFQTRLNDYLLRIVQELDNPYQNIRNFILDMLTFFYIDINNCRINIS